MSRVVAEQNRKRKPSYGVRQFSLAWQMLAVWECVLSGKLEISRGMLVSTMPNFIRLKQSILDFASR
jgi:G:T-mismatch repair DNA endonuclease (very short patch repair protein)